MVSRSGEICDFAVYTAGGDQYVETLTDFSFYAQIARQGSTFAHPAEVTGDVVQFSEVISDDELIRRPN